MTAAPRAIVTDIEGTTSTIAFVKDVLFPYADAHLDRFVLTHRSDAAVTQALAEVAALTGAENAGDAPLLAALHAWLAEDRKVTPLKTLQGLIWHEGYERGELHGHVYDDVPPVLREWAAAGITLGVYSSGSILAQRVLFAHTRFGDLTPLFRHYYDTTIGAKRERTSYDRIAAEMGTAPVELLFLSDVDAELDAARESGWQTARLMRAADTPPGATSQHAAYADFKALARVVLHTNF